MIRAFTAYTNEIDEPDVAVAEILEQLDFDGKLLANSIGFISCYAEFIDTGVVSALTEALPFETIGTTTITSLVKGAVGSMTLTLSVLSSDDVRFATGLTEEIASEDVAPFREAYYLAEAKLGEPPKLIFSFAPLLTNVGGDSFAVAMDEMSGGAPNFGSITVDHTDQYAMAQTIYNGEPYRNRYAFALVAGNVDPRFYVATIPPEKVGREKGVVTASEGNQLREIDGEPAIKFLERLGLVTKEGDLFLGMNTFPFVIDYQDGSQPVVRVAFAATPDGHVVCGGNFPVGSTISVGQIDADDVVHTAEKLALEAVNDRKADVMLMFSCLGRYLCLGYSPERECDAVRDALENTDAPPYQFTYSGGELCPLPNGVGKWLNHNHNDTFIVCTL